MVRSKPVPDGLAADSFALSQLKEHSACNTRRSSSSGFPRVERPRLYEQLKQHPSIYMSPFKETRYFAYDRPLETNVQARKLYPRTLEQYHALFADVKDETAVGEASPIYFENPVVAARIHEYNPNMKLIVALRHPVDRAESHYMMLASRGGLPLRNFADVVRERLLNNPSWRDEPYDAYYCNGSLYYDGLKRYFDLFPREQILVLKHEDLLKNAEPTYKRIFQFLGVDPTFHVDTTCRFHVGGQPRSKTMLRAISEPNLVKTIVRPLIPKSVRIKLATYIRSKNVKPKQPLSPADRREFMALFRDDVLKSQELTGVDMSNWLAD